MFTNKHVIAALLITPILAVLGYFAVDALVSEKPHKAKAGASYELIAKSNCRYTSGRCDFKNGDFKVSITLDEHDGQIDLHLESVFPLEGVKIALGGANSTPVALTPVGEDLQRWQTTFFRTYTGEEIMRVAIAAEGSYYYGETGTVFANYESSFGKDFRK